MEIPVEVRLPENDVRELLEFAVCNCGSAPLRIDSCTMELQDNVATTTTSLEKNEIFFISWRKEYTCS